MINEAWMYLFLSILFFLLKNVRSQCDATGTSMLYGTSTPYYLTSPNYPSPYSPNLNCSWRISGPGTSTRIIINIQVFDTDSGGDYLEIYDGYYSNSTKVIQMDNTNSNTLYAYASSSSYLYLTFTSNGATESTGFNILYFTNQTAFQPVCDTPLYSWTEETVLMSPNIPNAYTVSDSCSWTVNGAYTILFQIKFLDLSCGDGKDYLNFYDGNNTLATLLNSACSSASVYTFDDITTSGNAGHVALTVTNPPSSFYGFMLVYKDNLVTTSSTDATTSSTVATTSSTAATTSSTVATTSSTAATTSSTAATTTTTVATTTTSPEECSASGLYISAALYPSSNFINSPDYASGRYPSNSYCQWFVTAPTNYAVEASFDAETYAIEYNYYCNYDYVAFYDGNSTSASLINIFCGSSRPTAAYRSSGTQMLIIFSSDSSIVDAGFKISVSAVDNSYPSCKSGYTTYTATATTNTFSTSSSPYLSNQDEYFLVDNSKGGDLILQLTAMDVERASGCIYDRITIYDGGCTSFAVLDTHCGVFLKRWELTGTEYLVHFHSDSSVQQSGFTMEYYLGTANTGAPTTTTTTIGPPLAAEINLVNEVLTNYSSENLPVRNLSNAIKTNIEVFLAGISGLDEVQQKLTTTIQFEITWQDETLQWQPSKKMGVTKLLMPQDDLWKPDLALLNSFTKISAMGHKFMFIVVEYNGKCTWKPYQILESTCKADMTNFPYDTQYCDLKFSTWASSSAQVLTVIGAAGMTRHDLFVENPEWRLLEISQRNETINGQLSAVFTLTIQRNPSFIVFYVTLPVIFLSLLNSLTFALPVEAGEKSGYAITIFLSFLIYVIVTFQKMPESSDSISLFALYVLVLTGLSNLTVIISVLEIRMLGLKTKYKPMLKCTITFTKWILRLQKRLLCIRKETKEREQLEEDKKKQKVTFKNVAFEDDDDDEEEEEEDNTWPEFVSALDFVCFWVSLTVTLGLAVGYMVYLSMQ